MARRTQPWHRPPILADPRWFYFNGDGNGSPFASASPLYGKPSGLGDPAEEYGEPVDTPLTEAIYQLLERLSEDERDVFEMRLAGLPYSAISAERGWFLPPRPDRGTSPDATADKRKAHRIAARAARKLRRWIAEDDELADMIPPLQAAD